MKARTRSFVALARKEFSDIVRERTILVAIGIQFVVAAFSAFLLVGLTTLYDPSSLDPGVPVDVAYVGDGSFDDRMDTSRVLRVTHTDLATAMTGFMEGTFGAVVQETADPGGGPNHILLVVPEEEFQTTLVVSHLRGLLEDYESDLRTERTDRLDAPPHPLEVDAGPARDYGFTYGALLPLLLLLPAMLGGAITTDTLLQERSTGTLRLLLSAPVSPGMVVASKLLVPALLAPAQALMWLVLLGVNGVTVSAPLLLLAMAFVMALFFGALGVLVAVVVPREGQAQAAYALVLLVASGLAFVLPRDPLNLIALVATGTVDPLGMQTLVALAAATLVLLAVALPAGRWRFSAAGS